MGEPNEIRMAHALLAALNDEGRATLIAKLGKQPKDTHDGYLVRELDDLIHDKWMTPWPGKRIGAGAAVVKRALQKHPAWDFHVEVIGCDDQADRIAKWIGSEQRPAPEWHEARARAVFAASGGRLGRHFRPFWKRLIGDRHRTHAWIVGPRDGRWHEVAGRERPVLETDIRIYFMECERVPLRTMKAIEATGCRTLEELAAEWTEARLLALPSCGARTLADIKRRLASCGLTLGEAPEWNERRLAAIFDRSRSALGNDRSAFFARMRALPTWTVPPDLIGEDDQAHRIVAWIREGLGDDLGNLERLEGLWRTASAAIREQRRDPPIEGADEDEEPFRARLAASPLWTWGPDATSLAALIGRLSPGARTLIERIRYHSLTELSHGIADANFMNMIWATPEAVEEIRRQIARLNGVPAAT